MRVICGLESPKGTCFPEGVRSLFPKSVRNGRRIAVASHKMYWTAFLMRALPVLPPGKGPFCGRVILLTEVGFAYWLYPNSKRGPPVRGALQQVNLNLRRIPVRTRESYPSVDQQVADRVLPTSAVLLKPFFCRSCRDRQDLTNSAPSGRLDRGAGLAGKP